MAKLTRDQKRSIGGAIADLEASINYLMRDRTVICMASRINKEVPLMAGEFGNGIIAESKDCVGRDGNKWTIHFENRLTPVTKDRGSDLVRLWGAKSTLEKLLYEPEPA